ncbi:hypothetical protein AVEN_229024-1 [Araneus ventricosus]|uniref:DUF4817 domain-containing protein n=1 Tax=Araneus ventricosus TaxID=182803 RepID=A0A4Y2KLK0_ARAVE|nr:hypothetical protein AVEN_229024-1 [Araneus ventricosus]
MRLYLPTATRRSFQKRFNVPKGPDAKTIPKRLFAEFERTGSVDDNRVGNVGPRQTVVTPEYVAKVSGIVQQNPRNTVHRIVSDIGFKRSSTQKILRNLLRIFPYKFQSHRAIPIKSVRQRFDFAKEILTMIDNQGFDVGCMWFTDEAHFHLNGFVNNKTGDFGDPKILICVKRNHCIRLKLLLGLQYAAEALSALFSCEERSLVNITLEYRNNLSAHSLR